MMIKLQPARHIDHLTEDLTELTKLPYPFQVEEDGTVRAPRGYARAVGFAARLDRQQIDLWWRDAVKDPQAAKGMYLVTEDDAGDLAVHLGAIDEVTVRD